MTRTEVRHKPARLRSGRRRRWGRSSVALVSAIVIAGCSTVDSGGGGSSDSGGAVGSASSDTLIRDQWDGQALKVGFSPPILSEFYTQIEQSAFNRMKEYEERYGIEWTWERQGALNDAHSGAEAPGIIQGYIAREFDAVFICSAASADTMQEIYRTGAEEGVDFYQFNSTEELTVPDPGQNESPTGGLNTVSNIGYDDRWQSGYLAGQYIATQLEGQGNVIQILGPSGSDWTKLRQQGFEAAISQYPGMKIVGSADGGYVRDRGLTAAQDLLTQFPDVDAIYGENEDMALGASQAIDALGLQHWDGQQGIITIGADGLASGMEAIKAGKLTATVNVNSIEMGQMMVDMLVAHEVLGQAVPQFVRIPTIVVDKENVDWNEEVIRSAMSTGVEY
ncbi:sugar ABC transporter substrate-binding protein [Blastococcus sp. SYSU D00669]